MYETGRRARLSYVLRTKRLDWYGRLPDSREGFEEPPTLPDDTWEPAWFQVQNLLLCSQPPSNVLVEKVVRRDDVDVNNYQSKGNVYTAVRKKSRLEDKGGNTTINDDCGRDREITIGGDSVCNQSMRKERETRKLSVCRPKNEEVKAEWTHSSAVKYEIDAITIDQGCPSDGLGRVPQVATSMAVIRRMELDIDGFFTFLFSNRWKEGYLLRVLKGNLLDTLMDVLTQMEKYQDVVCYSTMAYIYQHRPLVPCNKMSSHAGRTEMVQDKVLVELDYFHPQQRPESIELQLEAVDSLEALSQGQDMVDPSVPQTECQSPGDSSEPPLEDQNTGDSLEPPLPSQNAGDSSEPPLEDQNTGNSSEPPLEDQNTGNSLEPPLPGQNAGDSSEPPLEDQNTGNSSEPPLQGQNTGDLSEPPLQDENTGDSSEPPLKSQSADSSVPSLQSQNMGDSSQEGQNMVESSKPSLQGQCSPDAEAAPDKTATTDIRCNIRGRLKPPPHNNCFTPYHMQREPYYLRHCHQQSAFPPLTLPELPPVQDVSSGNMQPEDTQDNDFLGPKYDDTTEPVACDVFLTPIPVSSKTQIKKEQSEKVKPAQKRKKKISKQNTTADEDSDIDDIEDTEIKPRIDPLREDRLKKDLHIMSSELVAMQPEPRTEKDKIQIRLQRQLSIKYKTRHEKDKRPEDTVKQVAFNQTELEEPVQPPPQESSIKPKLPADLPSTYVKQWHPYPSFAEFYNYLKAEKSRAKKAQKAMKSGSKSQKPKRPGSKATKEDDVSGSEAIKEEVVSPSEKAKKSSKRKKIKKVQTAEENENADQLKNDSKERKKKPSGEKVAKKPDKSQAKETKAKKKKKNEPASKQTKKTPENVTEEPPYVYISDSEVPDDITPEDLFTLMQVERNFMPQKLTSSYSFEKMFAHRPNAIRDYSKLLKKFSKPFKKKKPKPQKRSAVKKNKVSHPQPTQIPVTEQSPVEPSPPPMVIGKMKDFKFLQFKNFIPDPASASNISVPQNEKSFTDISQRLIVAMQKFVVRKERTTTYSPTTYCNSRVSLTFSKRAPQDFWFGVPPISNNIRINSSTECSCGTQ